MAVLREVLSAPQLMGRLRCRPLDSYLLMLLDLDAPMVDPLADRYARHAWRSDAVGSTRVVTVTDLLVDFQVDGRAPLKVGNLRGDTRWHLQMDRTTLFWSWH